MTAAYRGAIFSLVTALALSATCQGGTEGGDMDKGNTSAIRMAHRDGRWFPGLRPELEAMLREFLGKANPAPVNGRIVAAIAPHAGYIYSGPVAGYTFRAIRDNAATNGKPDTVVILGFSHRGGFPGVALLDGASVETPLGGVAIDMITATELAESSPRIAFSSAPHADEHSAENEIPFVQAALPGTKIVVGLMGDHDEKTVNDLVKALVAASAKRSLLVVASTDLLHDADYERVRKTDGETLAIITSMNAAKLAARWSYSEQVCCGIGPVLTVMKYAEAMGCGKGTLLHYRNSGDDYPESRGQWVVGYGAVVCASGRQH